MPEDVLSSFELVLPPNVVEACHKLETDCTVSFSAVNKHENTNSEITLHRRKDRAVIIHIDGKPYGGSWGHGEGN